MPNEEAKDEATAPERAVSPEEQIAAMYVEKLVQNADIQAFDKEKWVTFFAGFAAIMTQQIGAGFKLISGKLKQDLYDHAFALTVLTLRAGGEVLLTKDEIAAVPVGTKIRWLVDRGGQKGDLVLKVIKPGEGEVTQVGSALPKK